MKISKEAVIVVDYQNDFANPGYKKKGIEKGSLYVNGGEKIVWYINNLITDVKSISGLIVSTQDWHPINHTSFAKNHRVDPFTMIWDEVKWPVHCVQNDTWSDFFPLLNTDEIDERVYKGFDKEKECYSGFWGSKLKFNEKGEIISVENSLNNILVMKEQKILNILGLATDYCIEATVIDAIKNWFTVRLHIQWIAAVNAVAWDGDRAIERMRNMGAIIIS
jgi:nicotinamidase/pyrazinamidase